MTRSKCIYVVEVPVSRRDAERFGIKTLQTAGFDIQIWDLQALYLSSYPTARIDLYEPGKSIKVTTPAQLSTMFNQLSISDVVVCLAGMNHFSSYTHRHLHAALLKSDAVVTTILSGLIPESRETLFERALKRIRQKEPAVTKTKSFIRWFKYNALYPFLGLYFGKRPKRHLDYVFASTDEISINKKLINNQTSIVLIHSLDFDLCLSLDSASLEPCNYAVFLDSMGPLHPDLKVNDMPEIDIKINDYFDGVKKALNWVCQHLDVPVKIAAHPRATKQAETFVSLYWPFEVGFGKTNSWISDANIVIAEPSTSLAMAAWFRKPIALLDRPDYPDWYRSLSRSFQRELGCEIWDITLDPNAWKMPVVDERKYAKYVAKFIKKPGTPMKPFWEVVVDTLKERGLPVTAESAP